MDQILAEERTHLDGNGNVATQEVLWPLTDNQGTVRDVARMDGTTTSIVDHIIYESFGKVTSESNPSEGCLFKYTGRATDSATGIEFHNQRVKIAGSADWMSEDPIGFSAGDTNSHRYCFNNPTTFTDPSGLMPSRAEIEQTLDRLIVIARHTHAAIQPGHCDAWADAFIAAVPKSDAYTLEKVVWTYRMPGIDQLRDLILWPFGVPAGDVRLRHVAVKVTFSNGYVCYFDDGWWAGLLNNVFYESDIPGRWRVRPGR